MRSALLFLALLLVCGTAAAQAEAIDRIVLAEMRRQHSPAVAVAVVKDGVAIKVQGHGVANLEQRSSATAETLFQTASVGKQFVAALVMLLVRDGTVQLDAPLSRYLTDAPPAWQGITVRQLLNHTSGLGRIDNNIDLRKDYSETELLQSAYKQPLNAAPGERYEYSDLGYQLLGFLCSKLGGKFYGEQLRERLFAPLSMRTRIISEQDIIPGRAAGYERVAGRFGNQAWVAPSLNTTADGSLYASARDMARWAIALQRATVLRREETEALWQPTALANGKQEPYGLGWAVATEAGHRIVSHKGEWQGFSAHLLHMPEARLTISVLMNRAQAQPEVLAEQIAALYVKALGKPPALRPSNSALLKQALFLRGTMNEWKADAAFVPVGPGLLEARVVLAPGLHEFKVGDAEWKTADFGTAFDAPLVRTALPRPLAFKGDNLFLQAAQAGEHRFRLALVGKGPPVLTVLAPGAKAP